MKSLNRNREPEATKRIISVVSGKGGVGKTVTVANLASAIQDLGERIIVVDADLTASTLGLQLNFFAFPVAIQDVLKGRIDILKAIYIHPTGLRIIPSSIAVENIRNNTRKLKELLKKLEGIVLVDSPPGVTKDVKNIIKASDEILVVSTPDEPSIANSLKIIEMTKNMGKYVGGIIVTRTRNDGYELSSEEIESFCEVPVISTIPEDKNIRKSISEKTPLVRYDPLSPASIEYQKLGAELVGETFEEPNYLILRRMLRRIW